VSPRGIVTFPGDAKTLVARAGSLVIPSSLVAGSLPVSRLVWPWCLSHFRSVAALWTIQEGGSATLAWDEPVA